MNYKELLKQRRQEWNKEANNTQQVNDWDIIETKDKVTPKFIGDYENYYLSIKDIVEGINNSDYKINGSSIVISGEDGDSLLPDWGGGNGSTVKNYRLEMLSTQGNIIKNSNFTTTLKAVLYENNVDVTSKKDSKYFKWSRFSGATEQDQIKDMEWNLKWVNGAKEIPITADDVDRNAMFQVQFVTESEAKLWVSETYSAYQKLLKR